MSNDEISDITLNACPNITYHMTIYGVSHDPLCMLARTVLHECAGLFVVAKRVIGREERRVSEREGGKREKGREVMTHQMCWSTAA